MLQYILEYLVKHYKRGDSIFIQILTEPAFEESSWGKAIFDGLCSAIAKKKLNFQKIPDVKHIKKHSNTHFLILIGSDEKWLEYAIARCNEVKVHPVVLGIVPKSAMNGIYSSVTSDIGQSMYYLINHIKKSGKARPALYGINPASLTDSARKETFLAYAEGLATEKDIHYNNGSLKDCFENFFKNINNYDCVICANDYAAISLIKNLNNNKFPPHKLLTLSYGDTLLSRSFDSLLTVSMCYDEYGKAAISICETLYKNPALLYINIAVKWKIGFRDNFTKNELPDNIQYSATKEHRTADEVFYSDKEMCEMILVENMLCACDATDLELLNLIVSGDSYETAAVKCFISHNTVKYRMKKLMDICGCTSKQAFLSLVKKYR